MFLLLFFLILQCINTVAINNRRYSIYYITLHFPIYYIAFLFLDMKEIKYLSPSKIKISWEKTLTAIFMVHSKYLILSKAFLFKFTKFNLSPVLQFQDRTMSRKHSRHIRILRQSYLHEAFF